MVNFYVVLTNLYLFIGRHFLLGLRAVLLLGVIVTSAQYEYITVYIQPQPNSLIFVKCWTNNSNIQAYSQNFTFNGEFSWTVSTNTYNQVYDAYWCRATMGNSILTKFPIYGDGLLRNSSEWLINANGRRRISLINMATNDNKAVW